VVHEENAEQTGKPESTVGTGDIADGDNPTVVTIPPTVGTVPSDPTPVAIDLRTWVTSTPPLTRPVGLTDDGLTRYIELMNADCDRRARRFRHELTLYWIGLKIDGPETLTWDRVQDAWDNMMEKEEHAVIDDVRPELRTEIIDELRGASDRRATRDARATYRWATGSILSTASTTTIAAMDVSGAVWVKVALVTANVIGVLVCRPQRD
jgi:hypothetical protein